MNVIVSNKYTNVLKPLDVEIIKSLEGEYSIDEIISTFDNFFFARMILDITSIKNYKDISNLQKLSISMDMSKIILLLDDSPETSNQMFISQLVSMGIYNFTRNTDGVMYLLSNPNSYRDVAHLQQLGSAAAPQSVQQQPINNNVGQTNNVYVQPAPSFNQTVVQQVTRRVVGVKNVTEQSGATTLVYMMKRQLQKNYNVKAIEVDKRDFMFLNDKELITSSSENIGNELQKNSSAEIILIDINKSFAAESLCTDIIYLIEPSTIKLNKLMMSNRAELEKLKGKKVVLMQSVLTDMEVAEFEYESKLKVFYNLPPLDERKNNLAKLDDFLSKMGFSRQRVDKSNKKNGFLGIFD